MKEFLEFLVKSIVKNEDSVLVEEGLDMTGGPLLKLTVNKEDMGLIIGKEGRTIKSLRNLVKSKAIKEGKRINVELVETSI